MSTGRSMSVATLLLLQPALSPVAVLADDAEDDIQEMIVTSSRSGARLFDIPRSITVLGQQQIEEQLAFEDDLGAIIGRNTPGIAAGVNGNFNSNGLDQIRGRRLQFLVDGINQSNFVIDFRNEFQTIDPRAIERVEVIRGGTAVYGLGATGGIVNIITKAPGGDGLRGNSSAALTLQPAQAGDTIGFDVAQGFEGAVGPVDFRLYGNFRQRNTAVDADGQIIPSDSNLFETDQYNVGGTVGLRLTADQRLEFRGNFFEIEENDRFLGTGASPSEDIPASAVPAPVGAVNAAVAAAIEAGTLTDVPPESQNVQNYILRYTHADLFGSALTATGFYNEINDVSETLIFGNAPGDPFGRNEVTTRRAGARLTVTTPLEGLLGVIGDDGKATYGFDYEFFDFTQPNTADLPPLTPDIETNSFAGFLQLDLPIGDFRLSGGVRYETTDASFPDFVVSPIFNPNTTPVGNAIEGGTLTFDEFIYNAGLIYQITPQLQTYFSFAQGFVIGELLRQIRISPAPSVEAAGLEPQVTNNFEGGFRGQFEYWDFTLAGFHSRSELGSTFIFNDAIQATEVLLAPERIFGAELTVNYYPTDAWSFDLTFAYQEGRFDLDGDGDFAPLLGNRIQPPILTLGADFTGVDRLKLRVQALYGGSREEFPDDATGFGQGNAEEIFTVDLAAFYQLRDRVQLRVGVDNLLNSDFIAQAIQLRNQTSTFFNNPGTTITFGIDISY